MTQQHTCTKMNMANVKIKNKTNTNPIFSMKLNSSSRVNITIIIVVALMSTLFFVHLSNRQRSSSTLHLLGDNAPRPHHVQPTSTSGRQRVAVCLTGDVRTFTIQYVHESLLRHLIHPLRHDGRYDVDVFFNVRYTGKGKEQEKKKGNKTPETETNKTLFEEIATRKFESVFLHEVSKEGEIDDAELFSLTNTTFHDDAKTLLTLPPYCRSQHPGRNFFPYVNTPYSLYRFAQCSALITQRERQVSASYDYVYVTRPDFWMNDSLIPLPHAMADNNTVYVNMAPEPVLRDFRIVYAKPSLPLSSDQIMAGHRSVMVDTALRAVQAVGVCGAFSFERALNPEGLLAWWLDQHNVSVVAVAGLMGIVKRDEGLSCNQFELFEFEDSNGKVDESTKKDVMEKCYQFSNFHRQTQHELAQVS